VPKKSGDIPVCNPPQHFRARLRVAEYNVTGVFKGKRAIFELTHRLEAASYAPTALTIGSCGTPMQGKASYTSSRWPKINLGSSRAIAAIPA